MREVSVDLLFRSVHFFDQCIVLFGALGLNGATTPGGLGDARGMSDMGDLTNDRRSSAEDKALNKDMVWIIEWRRMGCTLRTEFTDTYP